MPLETCNLLFPRKPMRPEPSKVLTETGWSVRKLLFTLLFLLSAFPALAQVKHLVLDLETVLIQQIPYRNFQSFGGKENLFQISTEGKYHSFYVHLHAKDLLADLLKRKDVALSIISDRDEASTKLILESLTDPRFSKKDLFSQITSGGGKILTASNKVAEAYDLSSITSDLKNLVFITHVPSKVVAGQRARVLSLGSSYYKYETWDDARKNFEAATAAEKSKFAPTEEEWKRESYKIAKLAYLLNPAVFTQDLSILNKKFEVKADRNLASGLLALGVKGNKIQNFWVVSADGKTLVGCETVDLTKDAVIKKSPVQSCVDEIPAKLGWKYSADKSKVEGCRIDATEGGAGALVPASACLEKKAKAYWKGKTKLNCGYYTEDLVLIEDAKPAKCDDEHVLRSPQAKTNVVMKYFDGMESKSLEEIFAAPPPTAQDPYRLYNAYDVDPSVGFTIKDCIDPGRTNHPVKGDGRGNILENCKMDTLYSWGPMIKIQDLKTRLGDLPRWQNGFKTVYATRSPLATFGYGDYSIRIKLKKNLRWVQAHIGNCNPSDGPVIYYNPWGPGLDYGFCSPEVIESWSYGTKEHYDEIIKEYRWGTDPVRVANNEIDAYANYGSGQATVDQMFNQDWDGNQFSPDRLRSSLRLFQDLIQNEKGEIFFNPESVSPETKRADHYKTARPIYFNER